MQNLLSGAPGTYDLQTGLAWAATASTPAAQVTALTTVIQQTARTDPATAQAAVDANQNLTEAQRAQLTQQIKSAANQNGPGGKGNYNNINSGPPPQGYHYEYDGASGQILVPNN